MVQVLADAVLESGQLDDVLAPGHADALAEAADRAGRVSPAAESRDGGHAGVVPACDVTVLHQLPQPALAHDRVAQVEACELDLLGSRGGVDLLEDPVVEGAAIGELERAERVGDVLDCVREAVGEVVHRVDRPGIPGAVVWGCDDPVEDRIPHRQDRGGHVDLGAKGPGAGCELAFAHAPEEVEILLRRPCPVGAIGAGRRECPSALQDPVGAEVADEGLAPLDQLQGELVELLEIVRGEVEMLSPVDSQPAQVAQLGLDVRRFLRTRIGVVEA